MKTLFNAVGQTAVSKLVVNGEAYMTNPLTVLLQIINAPHFYRCLRVPFFFFLKLFNMHTFPSSTSLSQMQSSLCVIDLSDHHGFQFNSGPQRGLLIKKL